MGRTAGQPAHAAADRPSGVKVPPRPSLATSPVKPRVAAAPASAPGSVKPAAPSAPVSKPPAPASKPPPPVSKPPPPVPVTLAKPIAGAVVTPTPASPVDAVTSIAPRGHVECKTVREILPPWQVIQDKLQKGNSAPHAVPVVDGDQLAREALAAQEAANETWRPGDASVEVPPSSGVRLSEPPQLAQLANAAVAALPPLPPDSLLSFKVYTLAELERRSDAPVSMRASLANYDNTASRGPSHWSRVSSAMRAFGVAALAWYRDKELRPSIKIALREPFDQLGDALQKAVESVDWKKLGVTTGIVVGATLTLLFAVLTAAELTDDLKPPGSAAHLASMDTAPRAPIDSRAVAPATNMAAMGVQPVSVPNALMAPAGVAVPAAAAAPVTTIGDDPAEGDATPAPAKKPAAKKKKAAPAPAPNKLTFRNPDAVFHP